MATQDRRKGFTLVELLVALALTAILLSIVAQVFYQAGTATSLALGRTNKMQTQRGLVALLNNAAAMDQIHFEQRKILVAGTGWRYQTLESGVALPNNMFGLRYVGSDLREHMIFLWQLPDYDDDSDGKTDEDWHDGEDNDGDGKTDEDGRGTIGLSETLAGPYYPVLPDSVTAFRVRLYVLTADSPAVPKIYEKAWDAENGVTKNDVWDAYAVSSEIEEKLVKVDLRVGFDAGSGPSYFTVVRYIQDNTPGSTF